MKIKTRAVLFDLDGTLVETNLDFELMKTIVVQTAKDYGVNTESFRKLDILAALECACAQLINDKRALDSLNYRKSVLSALEEIEIKAAHKTKEIDFGRNIVENLKSENIKVGIVTRNCRKAAEISLQIANINPDAIVSRDDSEFHKPHPEHALRAINILKVTPKESVIVGDHLMDIACGKAAGLATIGLLKQNRPRDFFEQAKPDFIATNLRDIYHAIINCNR